MMRYSGTVMRKKKQTTSKGIRIRAEKGQRGKIIVPAEKPANETLERLLKIGEEISKGWQSEKSAVEILSEMRR